MKHEADGYRMAPDHRWLADFFDYVLVECPRCASPVWLGNVSWKTPKIRLVCTSCALAKQIHRNGSEYGVTSGGLFCYQNNGGWTGGVGSSFPLWLRSEFGASNVLWAVNWDHAEWLHAFVSARLRESSRFDLKSGDSQRSNNAYSSRLPPWIASAKNRDAVLRKLDGFLAQRRGIGEPPCTSRLDDGRPAV